MQQRLEELLAVEVLELRLAGLHRLERGLAISWREPVELLAVGLARPGIGGLDAGGKKFARGQRELIALLGFTGYERPAAIHPRAAAPGARELAVDVVDQTAIGAGRRKGIGWDDCVIGGAEECCFGRGQGQQRLIAGWRRGGTFRRLARIALRH